MILDFRGLISIDLKKHTTSIIKNDDDEIITFYISDKIGAQSTKHYTINISGNQEILSNIYFVGKKHSAVKNSLKHIFHEAQKTSEFDGK